MEDNFHTYSNWWLITDCLHIYIRIPFTCKHRKSSKLIARQELKGFMVVLGGFFPSETHKKKEKQKFSSSNDRNDKLRHSAVSPMMMWCRWWSFVIDTNMKILFCICIISFLNFSYHLFVIQISNFKRNMIFIELQFGFKFFFRFISPVNAFEFPKTMIWCFSNKIKNKCRSFNLISIGQTNYWNLLFACQNDLMKFDAMLKTGFSNFQINASDPMELMLYDCLWMSNGYTIFVCTFGI